MKLKIALMANAVLATPLLALPVDAGVVSAPQDAPAQTQPEPELDQDAFPPLAPPVPPQPPAPDIAQPAGEDQVRFSADGLEYDSASDTVTATGDVFLVREGYTLRADTVRWNRTSGEILATGNVAIRAPDGNIVYTDSIALTDSLRDGMAENLLLVLEQGGRLAAASGERFENGDMVLNRAVYSGCPVTSRDGCSSDPSWKIQAVRIYYDADKQKLTYDGAGLSLFGLPAIPLPFLTTSLGGGGASGLLVPEIGLDRVNGFEFALPYYWRIAENRDATFTPHLFSDANPMFEAQYRELTELGAFQVRGFATFGNRSSLFAPDAVTPFEKDIRGYLETSGRFQFSPKWSATQSARIASDRTFLRRYDISRDDRLRSTLALERIGGSSYFGVRGWAVQTLRAGDRQGAQPQALPLIDYRKRLTDPLLGGMVQLQANTLGIIRGEGQDTQRAFASAQWDLRRLTRWGQQLTLTALVRGDLYHSDENFLTLIDSYRGSPGFETRGIAALALDAQWPLAGPLFGGRQRVTPRIQIVATPSIENLSIPNEDSRAFELETINLFGLNRFPGYDRFEENARVTYGLDWAYNRPKLAITATAGQSYRLDDSPVLFPDGTGLSDRFSDYVGRMKIAYRDYLSFTGRFRLDKDNFVIRRNEVDLTAGSRKTYVTLGYLKLNRDIESLAEDLSDREEIRLGGRVAFARYWSVFGAAIVDLTGPDDDPDIATDGYEPIRHRLGVAYDDDCVSFGLTWRRDYESSGDAAPGNSFLLRVAFRNFGV